MFELLVKSAVTYTGNNQSNEVFFILNSKEMFGIDNSYPGYLSAVKKAFLYSKKYIPVDTGLTYRSYTMLELNDYTFKFFFDPSKIVGQNRKGKKVTEYYVQYIANSIKNMNWLTNVIYYFYTELYSELRKLENKKEKLVKSNKDIPYSLSLFSLSYFSTFYNRVKSEYNQMKEEKKKLEEQKQKELQIKFLELRQRRKQMKINKDNNNDKQ